MTGEPSRQAGSVRSPDLEVARVAGVNDDTIRRWCDTGVIEHSRTAGGHRRISAASLAAATGTSPAVGMSVRALRTRTEALLRDLEQVSYVHVDDEALDELIDVLTSHGGVLPRFTKVVQALEAEQVTRSRTQVTDLLSHLPTRPTSEKIRASDPAAPDTAGNPDNDDEHLTFKNEHGLDLDSVDRFLA